MFCEHCHGRVANVHLVRIINGKKVNYIFAMNVQKENVSSKLKTY